MRARSWLLSLAVIHFGLLSAVWGQQGVRWQPNLETARRLAAQTNRLVLVHFWTETCQPCMRMEHEVFSRSDVAAAIEANYVAVKVNVRQYPVTAQQFGVTSWPTDLVVTVQGKVIDKNVGFVAAEQYVGKLNQIAATVKGQAVPGYVQAPVSPSVASRMPPGATGPEPGGSRPGPAVPPNFGGATPSPSPGTGAMPYGGFTQNSPAGSMPPANNLAGGPRGYDAPPWQQGNTAAERSGSPTAPGDSRPMTPTDPPGVQTQPPAGAWSNSPSPQGTAGAAPGGLASGSTAPQKPAVGNPPLALDGYCAVTLAEKEQWVKGNPRFGVIHAGRTYLFAGQAEARRFYDNPERYAPANAGNDIVAQAERGQPLPGRREFGGFFEGRVYLFASEENYQKFVQDPGRYAGSPMNPASTAARRSDGPQAGMPPAGMPPAGPSGPGVSQGGFPPSGPMPSGNPDGAARPWPPAGRF